MGVVISVATNKGGVGKTSLITNLACVVAKENKGKRVLIVDVDGQSNCALAFSINPADIEHSIYDVMMGKKSAKEVIMKSDKNIDLLPSNDEMDFLEFDVLPNLEEIGNPFRLLADRFKDVLEEYDYIFIDTPPSIGLVTGNVLAVSDHVLIPLMPELYAVRGFLRMINVIKQIKEDENPQLNISGIIPMMVDSRTTLHSQMLQESRRICYEKELPMFETVIPKSIQFSNSTAYEGKPAVLTYPKHKVVKAYYRLYQEFKTEGIL